MQKDSMKTVWHLTWTCQIWENNIPQSAWEMIAPNIAQDDRTTNVQGFCKLQNELQEREDTIDALSHDNTRNTRET